MSGLAVIDLTSLERSSKGTREERFPYISLRGKEDDNDDVSGWHIWSAKASEQDFTSLFIHTMRPEAVSFNYRSFHNASSISSLYLGHHDLPIIELIEELSDSRYLLSQPIPVQIETNASDDYVAHFLEANLAMSGENREDALEMLKEDIVETFALYTKEKNNLGPGPIDQLSVLKRYVLKRYVRVK